jgi:RHS repeat-associated protein
MITHKNIYIYNEVIFNPQIPSIEAGYGFTGNGKPENNQYFYHSDHLGSTSYITDRQGNAEQFIVYMPYGEVLTEEHGSWESPYKFNGKEQDAETGLYYYGARYYEPNIGLWYGVDKLTEKYPNMGGYVYCVGNPIMLTDPDGRDAIYIAFPNYRANGIPFTGHAGVLLIDNKTGLTKYYEYGRYDKAEKGEVRQRTISNVVIGKDGKPTTESLNKVMKELSDISGHGGDIEGAYIISDKFKEMNDYAKSKMAENSDPNRKEYSITGNNCATFAEDVITQDKSVDKPNTIIKSPVNIVDEYQEEGNARVQYNAKTKTTTIGTGNEKDAKVKVKVND